MGAPLYDGYDAVRAGTRTSTIARDATAEETFARRLAEAQAFGAASNGLPSQNPALSARDGLAVWQRLAGWLAVAAFVAALFVATDATLAAAIAALAGVFLTLIAIRLLAVGFALAPRRTAKPRASAGELPIITLLVPLYREAEVLPDLVAAIGRLDYPADRLDVKLLIEADDTDTMRVAQEIQAQRHFEVIPVPPGQPRTKPKALNYGLYFSRGDIIAVFDAEDRPAPDQLLAAIDAFRKGDRRLAVVQAPLTIHNGRDSWLAAQFEVEYAIHFRVWLPFLARIGAPLALGGTSNYFRRDALIAAGGWDAWNVTEDADIGLRLARMGYRATMIAPRTDEEAPARLKPWLNQRTRWMKGYLQTWLVLNRNPIDAARGMGLPGYLLTQVTLGGSLLAAMAHGPLLLWTAASAVMLARIEVWHVALFALGYGSALAAALASGARQASVRVLLTLPLYWPWQSVAILRAFFEMKQRPHHWAKTPHGAYRGSLQHDAGRAGPLADENVVQLPLPF